jgi:hypothetical protein
MKVKDKHWSKNISPVDWYVAFILVRFEWYDEDKSHTSRRCLAWENQILIKANNPEEAYAKAIELGEAQEENGEMWEVGNKERKRKGRWRFEGLTSLIPLYDELQDGAEISWKEHKNCTVKKIQSRVKQKETLEVFVEG